MKRPCIPAGIAKLKFGRPGIQDEYHDIFAEQKLDWGESFETEALQKAAGVIDNESSIIARL